MNLPDRLLAEANLAVVPPRTAEILREAAAALSVPEGREAVASLLDALDEIAHTTERSLVVGAETYSTVGHAKCVRIANEAIDAYAIGKPTTPQPGDGWVLAPVRLPADAVSGIKDILESNYNMPSVKARPLWASLLEIIAGLSIEEQEAINEARANLHATNAAAPSAKGV